MEMKDTMDLEVLNLLCKKVLEKITPTEEEHEKEKEIVNEILNELKKWKEIKPILVGSLAKGTDLRGDKDIDIFIKFHESVPRKELEKKGLEIGKEIFKKFKAKYEIDYAEHPYLLGSYRGYKIEIVPCYDIKKGKSKSAVDRTPFHTEYIKEKLKKNELLRDEIRLLKQFMKGINVYGAEAKIQGFSGYLTELLIIQYGSFEKVLRKAANDWRFPQILDPENLWKTKEEKEALPYFFSSESYLIVIDPVDKDRNVAAAISKQKLGEFIIASREFLKSPKKEFFFPKEKKVPKKEELKKMLKYRGSKVIAILFSHPRINPNTLYSQLRKTKKSIFKFVQEKGFKILKAAEWSNEENTSILLFEFEVWTLPKVEHHLGPPIDSDEREQEKFLKKYNKAYIEGERWVVDRKRKFQQVEKLMQKILKERNGFGKNLKEVKKVELFGDEKVIEKIKDKGFLIYLGEFFMLSS
jgi:tRNA nucleotidyltransferase (CCA-adding enzyme)